MISIPFEYIILYPQKSKEMVKMGITGPEGHEMCRPEEVCPLCTLEKIRKSNYFIEEC